MKIIWRDDVRFNRFVGRDGLRYSMPVETVPLRERLLQANLRRKNRAIFWIQESDDFYVHTDDWGSICQRQDGYWVGYAFEDYGEDLETDPPPVAVSRSVFKVMDAFDRRFKGARKAA